MSFPRGTLRDRARREGRADRRIRASVGLGLYHRIVREAAARGISLSRCIRKDLEELYAIRDELSQPLELRAEDGARPRLLHRLLAETETRLAADLGRQAADVASLREALERLDAMLDRQYFGLMLHLPPVQEDLRKARTESAIDRHRAWRQAVDALAKREHSGA